MEERGRGELLIDKQMRCDGGGEVSGFGLGLAHTAIGGMVVGAGWVGRRGRIYDAMRMDGASRSHGVVRQTEERGAVNFGVRPFFSSLR